MINAQQEKGHLYKAEKPSFHKGETGKGVAIGGKITSKAGTPLKMGDSYAGKLREEWSKAENASGKFNY